MSTEPQEQESGTKKHASTIPSGKQGVGLGAGEDANTFEPEEDPEAPAGEDE